MTLNILIDCDPGHDDAVAILLANKLANLTSITTVAGNTDLANTTRNALALVELLGTNIPVHSGAYQSLGGEVRDAQHVHGKTGFGGTDLPQPTTEVASEDAVSHIIEQARAIDDLWLVAVGPLTNIALAIEEYPAIVSRVAGLSIMGGSTGSGNATPAAEFNIWADPEAARTVLTAGLNPIICGLNLTQQFLSDDDFVETLAAADQRVPSFIAELYTYMHERMDAIVGERRAALHDPCAVLALTHPQLFEFEDMYVDVELSGELTRGMTLFDQRRTHARNPANCRVATKIDAKKAREVLLSTLLDNSST
ncbi:MAG: nucleoside hydrolase [Pseudomonadales bacterium]|nr:nucleoside hydrolase [Pseudomonadales bacterium]